MDLSDNIVHFETNFFSSKIIIFIAGTTLVGESCSEKSCPKTQFCNEYNACQCCPGYKNFEGVCVKCSGNIKDTFTFVINTNY